MLMALNIAINFMPFTFIVIKLPDYNRNKGRFKYNRLININKERSRLKMMDYFNLSSKNTYK